MKTIRTLLLLLAAVVSQAQTPEPQVSLADTEQRTLTSSKIGQRYELLVSLPADYAKSDQAYPVLYVLDGWHFPLMAYLQNNIVFSKRMDPVIIVNVSHGGTDYMALRARDFTPTRTVEAGLGGYKPSGIMRPRAMTDIQRNKDVAAMILAFAGASSLGPNASTACAEPVR